MLYVHVATGVVNMWATYKSTITHKLRLTQISRLLMKIQPLLHMVLISLADSSILNLLLVFKLAINEV